MEVLGPWKRMSSAVKKRPSPSGTGIGRVEPCAGRALTGRGGKIRRDPGDKELAAPALFRL